MSRVERTRQRLQEEAIRLFSERGFDAVTVEEVAKAAGVSHMTFFRHFPTKESVVLDDPYDPIMGDAVRCQDPGLPALERVRRAILDSWQGVEGRNDEMTRARIVLAASHPSLRARVWENNRGTEEVLVAALTETGTPRFEATIAAGAVLGALTAALFDWVEFPGDALGGLIVRAVELLAPTGALS
ncbi:MAG: TetR family transcriptional regulator [Acidimicrobiia bacterium]|nr:TetR family transcriptional regulator [Acidimicrobiia bacterium]